MLPFLKPAIISAGIIAFLASFENYNTTVFTISHLHTFTTIISQKVRLGIDPSISAVAFIIIALTVIGAFFYEGLSKRGELKKARRLPEGGGAGDVLRSYFKGNPAMIMGVMVVLAAAVGVWMALDHSAVQCKADLLEKKLERQRQLEEQYRLPGPGAGDSGGAPASQGLGAGSFGNVFDPKNLEGAAGVEGGGDGDGTPQKPGQSTFGNVFDPKNLEGQAGVDGQEDEKAEPKEEGQQ
jgi:spermidine/putrescine transport system permease protein